MRQVYKGERTRETVSNVEVVHVKAVLLVHKLAKVRGQWSNDTPKKYVVMQAKTKLFCHGQKIGMVRFFATIQT